VLQDGEVQRIGSEQSIRVSVRVISATNRVLEDRIADGKFREDIFYRLSVVPIRMPALRERLQDVRDLAAYFLSEFCTRNNFRHKAMDEEVLQLLERYLWPGNIRELRNTVERMAILSPDDRITMDSMPLEIRTPTTTRSSGLHEVRDSAERDRIRQALEQTEWNVAGAARVLGIERTNLHKRMKALGLNRDGA
jgi:DNA-binding NtrC family response regulator